MSEQKSLPEIFDSTVKREIDVIRLIEDLLYLRREEETLWLDIPTRAVSSPTVMKKLEDAGYKIRWKTDGKCDVYNEYISEQYKNTLIKSILEQAKTLERKLFFKIHLSSVKIQWLQLPEPTNAFVKALNEQSLCVACFKESFVELLDREALSRCITSLESERINLLETLKPWHILVPRRPIDGLLSRDEQLAKEYLRAVNLAGVGLIKTDYSRIVLNTKNFDLAIFVKRFGERLLEYFEGCRRDEPDKRYYFCARNIVEVTPTCAILYLPTQIKSLLSGFAVELEKQFPSTFYLFKNPETHSMLNPLHVEVYWLDNPVRKKIIQQLEGYLDLLEPWRYHCPPLDTPFWDMKRLMSTERSQVTGMEFPPTFEPLSWDKHFYKKNPKVEVFNILKKAKIERKNIGNRSKDAVSPNIPGGQYLPISKTLAIFDYSGLISPHFSEVAAAEEIMRRALQTTPAFWSGDITVEVYPDIVLTGADFRKLVTHRPLLGEKLYEQADENDLQVQEIERDKVIFRKKKEAEKPFFTKNKQVEQCHLVSQ